MEGTDAGGRHKGGGARTRHELTIEVWVGMGRAAVGENELREIQRAIAKRFGEGAVDSPAAIARLLADEGAELRHPEVIEFDARWREMKIESGEFPGDDEVVAVKPLTLKQAETLIRKFERVRGKFGPASDHSSLQQ